MLVWLFVVGFAIAATLQKGKTAMQTTIPQIIQSSSNQQHLSVELMSRWAKVLLSLTN